MWGWTVDNFQLSETALKGQVTSHKGRTGRGGSRRVGQLRKLRVSRPQASLCAGACVCARVADVKGTTLSKRPQEFPGHFLSIVSGQVYCGACHTNIGSAKTAVRQHTEGKEHIQKVHSKVAGSDRGTKILECITAYKVMVKDSTGGQEPVGFERVPENVQV